MAIYSPKEYSKKFRINGKNVSSRTIRRMCNCKLLQSNHIPHKVGKRFWIIEEKEIPDNWKKFDILLRPKL